MVSIERLYLLVCLRRAESGLRFAWNSRLMRAMSERRKVKLPRSLVTRLTPFVLIG